MDNPRSRHKVVVYIDGLNFYHAVRGTPFKWVDFAALAQKLVPRNASLVGAKYFTAQISGKAAEDPATPRRHRQLIRAVAATPGVEVIEGKFQVPDGWRSLSVKSNWPDIFRPRMPAQIITANPDHFDTHRVRPWKALVQLPQEKFTDVAIGAHLLRDFYREECTKAIVVTNDADLRPAIELAVQDGHDVGVISPDKRVSRDLDRVASWARPMQADLPEQCQMPDEVRSGNRVISRPRAWK